jgi:flagellar basal body-associated protein FliL
MVLAVIAINTVSTGGLVAVTLRQRPAMGAPVKPAVDPGPGPMLRMEPLIIQLRRTREDNSERYLRLSLDFEMQNEADRSAYLSRLSRVNDSLLSFFSDQSVAEVKGGPGLEHIKAVVAERLKAILPGHAPKKVYITDFLIQ